MLLARAPAHRLDLILDVGEFARNQDFVVGSKIGAPEDIEVRFGQTRKRLCAVEQYDHAAEFAGKAARELASGSQQHAFADLIERDAMFRRQHLHAADPGDHLDVQREPLGAHALDDPQRAVVDRGIAPYQNASDFVFLKLALEAVTIDIGEATMPFVDAGEIVAGARALRDVDVDGAVIRMFDEALADRGAQIAQGGLLGPLVGNEEHVDLVERLDRLDGHVIGIADADADDEYLAHLSLRAAALSRPLFQPHTTAGDHQPGFRGPRRGALAKQAGQIAKPPQHLVHRHRCPADLVADHDDRMRRGAKTVKLALPRGNKRSEEHTSELQSRSDLVCRLLLEKKKK